jgi:hypothetical protein
MRSLSFCAQFLTGVGLSLKLMASDLCGYTSLIEFVMSVFVKLAGGRRQYGLREVFIYISLKDEALWLPLVPLC